MKFSKSVPQFGDVKIASVFCWLPKTFIIQTDPIKKDIWGNKTITYWLESIEVHGKYTKGSYGHFWKTIQVNGLPVAYSRYHLPR